jgi:hypothetical protein
VQAHADQVLEQAGEIGVRARRGCVARSAGCDAQRARAAPGVARDEAFAGQLLQRAPHRDARHAELRHQREFAGQALGETAVVQLLAQHQVDLVVFRQRHLRHATDVFAVSMFCQWDI